MLEDVRRYVRAGLEALSSQRSEEVVSRLQALAENLSSFAGGFLEWSAEARASLVREVKDLVARQVQEMGLATEQQVEALRARVDRLERAAGLAAGRGRETPPSRRAGPPEREAEARRTGRPAARASPRRSTRTARSSGGAAPGSPRASSSGTRASSSARPSSGTRDSSSSSGAPSATPASSAARVPRRPTSTGASRRSGRTAG